MRIIKEEQVLTPAQREAIAHKDGPMLVIAGPGAGKTMVITRRLKKMVEEYGILPQKILVITFTRAAAQEMEERYQKLTGKGKEIRFGTFHSVFYEWLRRWKLCGNRGILTEQEKISQMFPYFQDIFSMKDEEAQEKSRQFLSEYDKYRNEGRDLTEISAFSCCERDIFLGAVGYYKERKDEEGKMDYEDMQQQLWEVIKTDTERLREMQEEHEYFLVDEFQDINPLQYKILQKLIGEKSNIFAVGDEDQSIYGFRGASPDFLIKFPEAYPDCRMKQLLKNYRCSGEIVKVSQKLICHNTARFGKELQAVQKQGDPVLILYLSAPEQEAVRIRDGLTYYHDKKEVSFEDMAVLVRTHQRLRPIMKALMDGGIPFQSKEKISSFYDHWMARDMRTYFQMREDPEDSEAFSFAARQAGIPEFMIRETVRQGGHLPERMTELPGLTAEQRGQAEAFFYHWKQLGKRDLPEGMEYLWYRTGYGRKVKQYADQQFLSMKKLQSQREQLWESMKACGNLSQWEERRIEYERSLQGQCGGVHLSTMHGAKGLEFPLVWCAAVSAEILPHKEGESIEEERRIFYVGLTRAKKYLIVSGYGSKHKKSLFMEEIKERES